MVRRFVVEANNTLSRDQLDRRTGSVRHDAAREISPGALDGTIATGELFYPILARYVSEMNERWKTRLKVVAVPNRFFGEEITVAGLIAGSDLLAARGSLEGNFLIVPEQACLKSGQIFLDDLSLEDLERELRLPVAHGGSSLSSAIERAVSLEAGTVGNR
jgi:NifB/MoaA-like Fe-S oxidoreductase